MDVYGLIVQILISVLPLVACTNFLLSPNGQGSGKIGQLGSSVRMWGVYPGISIFVVLMNWISSTHHYETHRDSSELWGEVHWSNKARDWKRFSPAIEIWMPHQKLPPNWNNMGSRPTSFLWNRTWKCRESKRNILFDIIKKNSGCTPSKRCFVVEPLSSTPINLMYFSNCIDIWSVEDRQERNNVMENHTKQ